MGLKIPYLISGGIITNYNCTSRCRHCLYNCSPKRDSSYIDSYILNEICKVLITNNCYSIHIGGGEPFLNFESLLKAVNIIQSYNINIEYIETNASWFNESKINYITELKKHGVKQLLISISPFHNEYITFKKTKSLIKACNEISLDVFPWIMDFFYDLSKLNENKTHSIDEYKKIFGDSYLNNILNRYWIHFGGRAIDTFKNILQKQSVTNIIENSTPCHELTNTSHFHFDLYGNFIPGLCSGFAIPYNLLNKEINKDNFPIINMLYIEGIKQFYNFAIDLNFQPKEEYLNKCDLCNDIRKHLIINKKLDFNELKPVEYYYNF